MATIIAHQDAEVSRLRDDVSAILGGPCPELTDVANLVPLVEAGLKRLFVERTSLEALRRLRLRAVLYVGSLIHRTRGGEWSLCEDPKDAEVGQLSIQGWSPSAVIHGIGPASRAGLLLDVVTHVTTLPPK